MLVTALKQLAEKTGIEVNIVGLGGKKMLAAGANILADTMGISGMGTIEVVSFIVPTRRSDVGNSRRRAAVQHSDV